MQNNVIYFDCINKKLKLRLLQIRINLNCNLKCKNCSFHGQYYPTLGAYDIDIFEHDLKILSNILFVHTIQLTGGEPLLNDKLEKYIDIIKKYFSASVLVLFTNGILLKEINIDVLKKIDNILITKYKHSNLDYLDLEKYLFYNFGQQSKYHFLNYPVHENFDVINPSYKLNELKRCRNELNYNIYNGYFYYCQRPVTTFFVQKYIFKQNIGNLTKEMDGIKIDETLSSIKLFRYINDRSPLYSCLYCSHSLKIRS